MSDPGVCSGVWVRVRVWVWWTVGWLDGWICWKVVLAVWKGLLEGREVVRRASELRLVELFVVFVLVDCAKSVMSRDQASLVATNVASNQLGIGFWRC